MNLHEATAADPPPWERQPGESARAFAAFAVYRDMPPNQRNRGHVRGTKGAPRSGLIGRWSSRWNWQPRVLAYDVEQDRQHRQRMTDHRRRMAERQIRTAQLAQNKAVQWLMDLDPADLTASEAARLWEVAVRVERAAVGEPDRLDVTTGPVVGDLSAEEVLARLVQVRQRISGVLPDGA